MHYGPIHSLVRIAPLALAVLLSSTGCRRDSPSATVEPIPNSPASPEEGRRLMKILVKDPAYQALPSDAQRHIRASLQGRLYAAGLEPSVIHRWVENPLSLSE